MKAIKTLLAVSALATVTNAANATVWDITLTQNNYFYGAAGPLIISLSGIYDDTLVVVDPVNSFDSSDDISYTGAAIVGGLVQAPGFATTNSYNTMVIAMDSVTGHGHFFQPDSSSSNCTSNTTAGCPGFTQALIGDVYNAINFAVITDKKGRESNDSTGTPFTAGPGIYTWSWVTTVPIVGKAKVFNLPFTVTLSAQSPAVPIPAAAWLFGSGLFGLAGMSHRRRRI